MCLLFSHQALSPQMIILRVAMGRGLLKETVKEINTTPIFAKPATVTAVDEKCRGVRMTIYDIEGSPCGPGTPAASSDTSASEHIGTVVNACWESEQLKAQWVGSSDLIPYTSKYLAKSCILRKRKRCAACFLHSSLSLNHVVYLAYTWLISCWPRRHWCSLWQWDRHQTKLVWWSCARIRKTSFEFLHLFTP